MNGIRQDIRFAARAMARTPALTLAAVFALALSIGANTAVFGVVDAVLLRPLPYPDPERLLIVMNSWEEKGFPQLSALPSDYLEWRNQTTVFEELAASELTEVNLTGEGEPERAQASRTSANLFSLLGVGPVMGRGFLESEDRPGAPRVAVISHGLWQRRLGGRQDVIGRPLLIDGRPHVVVGVMPRGFSFSLQWRETGLSTPPIDLWVPLALRPEEMNNGFSLAVVGRLKPGVGIERARADLKMIGDRITGQKPDHQPIGVLVIGLHDFLTRDVRPAVASLGFAVGLVLLIACANVANLLLAKAAGRRREMAVRAALGAGRWRLLRQSFTEGLLLAAVSGACGLGIAWLGTRTLAGLAPPAILRNGAIGLDLRLLAFTAGVSLLAATLFGLVPALQAFRLNLDATLREAARGAVDGARTGRLRAALVVAEVALAVLLVVGSALLLQSFIRTVSVDAGFERQGVTTGRVSLPVVGYNSRARITGFYEGVLGRLRSVPEVAQAGLVATPPLRSGREVFFRVEGQSADGDLKGAQVAASSAVDDGYFKVMGIPLKAGRLVAATDGPGTELVVVVDETLAARYWPGQDPVGKRLREGYSGTSQPWFRVVGVVGAVRQWGLTADPRPAMYTSFWQLGPREMTIVARGRAGDAAMAAALRAAVRQVDPNQPVAEVRTMADAVAASVAPRRFSASLITVFAAVALLLAAVGVYAITAYSVVRRTREIGIRKALGASSGTIIGAVMRDGLGLVGTGLIIGCVAAAWLGRYLTSELYGVRASDPLTFAAACGALILVAAVACYVPARRANAVDPVVALRSE